MSQINSMRVGFVSEGIDSRAAPLESKILEMGIGGEERRGALARISATETGNG